MKTKYSINRYIVYTLLVAFAFMGGFVGIATFNRYKVLVNGILGISFLYLFFRLYIYKDSDTDESLEELFFFPENVKYFVFIFFGGAIFYWACGYAFLMGLALIRWVASHALFLN